MTKELHKELPRFRVNNILVDVDETLLTSKPGLHDPFTRTLESVVMSKLCLSQADAQKAIKSAYDCDHQCVSCALPVLGISEEEYLKELMPVLKEHLFIYPDAVNALNWLREHGFHIYPATSNSAFSIRTKVMSLASCFDRLLGGSEVHPEGKSGPAFYRSLISKLEIDPASTLMIGDSPTADLQYSLQAGLSKIVIIDRKQKDDWLLHDSGAVFVRSLELVPRMLEPDAPPSSLPG